MRPIDPHNQEMTGNWGWGCAQVCVWYQGAVEPQSGQQDGMGETAFRIQIGSDQHRRVA